MVTLFRGDSNCKTQEYLVWQVESPLKRWPYIGRRWRKEETAQASGKSEYLGSGLKVQGLEGLQYGFGVSFRVLRCKGFDLDGLGSRSLEFMDPRLLDGFG